MVSQTTKVKSQLKIISNNQTKLSTIIQKQIKTIKNTISYLMMKVLNKKKMTVKKKRKKSPL